MVTRGSRAEARIRARLNQQGNTLEAERAATRKAQRSAQYPVQHEVPQGCRATVYPGPWGYAQVQLETPHGTFYGRGPSEYGALRMALQLSGR